jgi:hypothetical protein
MLFSKILTYYPHRKSIILEFGLTRKAGVVLIVADPLRDALHGLYVGVFRAHRKDPKVFHFGRLTTIMTALMGIEDIGWRVVGITPEALEEFAEYDFERPPRTICRGHLAKRVDTARFLFDRKKCLDADTFIKEFLIRDRTVLMLNAQNRHTFSVPAYIKICNPRGDLFPNGSMIGWKHRNQEREFLRRLYQRVR